MYTWISIVHVKLWMKKKTPNTSSMLNNQSTLIKGGEGPSAIWCSIHCSFCLKYAFRPSLQHTCSSGITFNYRTSKTKKSWSAMTYITKSKVEKLLLSFPNPCYSWMQKGWKNNPQSLFLFVYLLNFCCCFFN